MDGGGRGGGGRYGHYGGGGRHHRHRRGGRGGRYRHQPYNNRSRGPRGGRGNRFGGQQTYQDPQTLMVRQVSAFVSRAGEFKNMKESDSPDVRSVVFTTAANINDLTAVLCAEDKLEILMKFQAEMEESAIVKKPEEKVGKLVHLVVGCAAGLPLQTPCYAALTLSVHEHVKGTTWEGFASRCLEYTMMNIAIDLDNVLLLGKEQSQAACRVKLLLRYVAMLGKMGIVKTYGGEETAEPNKMTVFGLLLLLVEAAVAAMEQHNNQVAAYFLSMLVLSTLPYIVDSVPRDVMNEKLLKPIETLMVSYKSIYTPGSGIASILLKDEQIEEDGDEEEDDDEEDDDDDDDDDESSGQICDSLQDLLRSSKRLMNEGEPSKFALPVDAPWKGLSKRSAPQEGAEAEMIPIVFSDAEPMPISFNRESEAVALLLGSDTRLKLQCYNLDGIVFGRLPIFGSPPNPDDDDDEDEEEEGMEEAGNKNEHLQAFQSMSILDRYFVAETVRDCLISHESHVNPTGLQHGSAKSAAEELLSAFNVFTLESASAGFEYAILETLLAFIAQSTEDTPMRHIFLSRVLLELTKLEPSRLAQALAVSMTNLFQDYLPALNPISRENFSRWFAFHLINTDYQWPSAFWKLWEPYATSKAASSRGTFVRRSLNIMAENLTDPSPLLEHCLSETKSMAPKLFGRGTTDVTELSEDSQAKKLELEVHRRVWDNDEDPSLLHDFLIGEEVTSALASDGQETVVGNGPKTDILIRVIVDPAQKLRTGIMSALEKSDDEDQMAEDDVLTKDSHVIITDAITRYKQTLSGVLEKEAEGFDGDKQVMIDLGGAFLLRRVESAVAFNPSLLQAIVSSLIRNGVVSDLAVLKWSLGDLGDAVTSDVVPRWWVYAMDCFQERLNLLESEATAGGSMAIDGAGIDSNDVFASQAAPALMKMVQYAVKRVCTLVSSSQGDEKRLKPLQVDLIDGMKFFAHSSRIRLVSIMTTPSGIRKASTTKEALDALVKSNISGSLLGAMCSEYDNSIGVTLLRRSLEQL